MTTDNTYNGYVNYETWNVCLWFANEEPLYRDILRQAPFDSGKVRDFVLDYFPTGTPDFDSPSDYAKVDWDEVAQDFNEMAEDSD